MGGWLCGCSELVQQLVQHSHQELTSLHRQQELAMQQQAYEMALTSATASAQMAMHRAQVSQGVGGWLGGAELPLE